MQEGREVEGKSVIRIIPMNIYSLYPSYPPYFEKFIDLQVVPGSKISHRRRKHSGGGGGGGGGGGSNDLFHCNCKYISVISCVSVFSEIF